VSGSDPRLIVVRHGRTAWNATGRYQGHADRPLDATGRAQAAGLVPVLAPLRPVRIVTSDLRRARDTAAPLARASGLALHPDPGLREVDVGAWEGLTRAEAAERHPDEMAAWERGDDVARGGGETRRAAGVRAADALVAHLAAVPAGGVMIAVAHGLVLRAAVDELAGRGVVVVDGPAPHLGNAEWVEVRVRGATRPATSA
jgi:broad specificity phosphatase PhoE